MEKVKDYCTKFPEYWYFWISWYRWKRIYIGDCCKKHDENCSTKVFIKCLKRKKIVGRYLITLVASTACLLRYGKV